MKTIGVLGGMSNQATVEYYRIMNDLVNQREGGWHTAEVIINSVDFGVIEHCVRNDLWERAGIYLASKAEAIERAGAGLLICVSNTMHRVAEAFTHRLTIPFIHIADPTGTAVRAVGLKRVGILGTKPVMSGQHLKRRYAEKFGLELIVPPEEEQSAVDRIIFDELVRRDLKTASKSFCLTVVDGLQKRGAEGVILGCTELFLLIDETDRPGFPIFDTTRLHACAAVDAAFAG